MLLVHPAHHVDVHLRSHRSLRATKTFHTSRSTSSSHRAHFVSHLGHKGIMTCMCLSLARYSVTWYSVTWTGSKPSRISHDEDERTRGR